MDVLGNHQQSHRAPVAAKGSCIGKKLIGFAAVVVIVVIVVPAAFCRSHAWHSTGQNVTELNFRVRNGNGCDLGTLTADIFRAL